MTLQHAQTLVALGRHREALEVLSGLGDEGLSAHAHCVRATALLNLGENASAATAAAAARAVAPEWERGYQLGAIAAYDQGRVRQAAELTAEAVRMAPHDPER